VTANWSDLGFTGSASVRDLWQHSDLGQATTSFSALLPAHGSRLLNVKLIPGSSHLVPPFTGGPSTSYEAESPTNTLTGNAQVISCSTCSGGAKVGNLGGTGTLQFNNVFKQQAGVYTLTIYYTDGDSGRPMDISVDGGSGVLTDFHGITNNNWNQVQQMQIPIQLNAGNNIIKFFDATDYPPDLDRITI
jgi:hypothetical protein